MLRDIHGGNIYGRNIILDFSANINPLGMPENVKKAVVDAVLGSERYPDPYCLGLIRKLSVHEKINEENIVCGNGADDLIYRIAHALRPKTAIIMKPTFSEYSKALHEVGCDVTEYAPENIIDGLSDCVDVLVLCNPNNPTGQLIDDILLKNICEKCKENKTILLCDECFTDLCKNGNKHSAKQYMNDNTIILKAFTKTYAMPGLRLGYALFGSTGVAEKVRNSGQYWSVSTVAQAAGIAALDECEYVERALDIISAERKYLSEELGKCGLEVYHSDANFILFRCGIQLDELLLGEGILIRNCADYNGLGNGFFRVAVRLHDENEALIDAVRKVTKWRKT